MKLILDKGYKYIIHDQIKNDKITSIEVLENNIFVPTYDFYGSSYLESVLIRPGVEIIGMGSFGGCEKLKKVILPDTVKMINTSAFAYSALEEITIGSNIERIEPYAFKGVKGIKMFHFGTGEDIVFSPLIYTFDKTRSGRIQKISIEKTIDKIYGKRICDLHALDSALAETFRFTIAESVLLKYYDRLMDKDEGIIFTAENRARVIEYMNKYHKQKYPLDDINLF